jgi:formylglycine-generating enzyme required for sulfatase activity
MRIGAWLLLALGAGGGCAFDTAGLALPRAGDGARAERSPSRREGGTDLATDLVATDRPAGGETLAHDQPRPLPGKWIPLAAGSFTMGSLPAEACRQKNETQHKVTLTHGLLIMAHETTQADFASVMGYSPSLFATCGTTCPVENVSWHEAAAYCNALSASQGLKACYACTGSGPTVSCSTASAFAPTGALYGCPGYRLPTEAEWEYAYRAGTTSALYSGKIVACEGSDPGADSIGWYKANAGGTSHPVGQKGQNGWGLYDLAGNVWEWVHDRYLEDLGAALVSDPIAPETGPDGVCRGGSWLNDPKHMRAAW